MPSSIRGMSVNSGDRTLPLYRRDETLCGNRFEADILEALLMIVRQYREGRPTVEIQYKRAVRPG